MKGEVEEDIENNINQELNKKDYSIIYLSRIGVIQEVQDMNIGQVLSNFFEFLVKRNKERTFIYVKIIEEYKEFITPTYDFIARNDDEKWGSYYLISKFLDFD